MRFLLAAHPTAGHTQALRAIGRELLSRGHGVRFAMSLQKRALPAFLPVPPGLRAAEAVTRGLGADGFTLVPLPTSLSSAWTALKIASARGYDELDLAMELFTAGASKTARVVGAELRARPADVVVADCFHFGVWLGAELASVPFVAVFHSGLPFPAPGYPPFGTALADGDDPVRHTENERRLEHMSEIVDANMAKARRALGLGEIAPGALQRPYAKALNVMTTFEAFELPRPHLAESAAGPILWAGPCLGKARPTVAFPWERLEGSKPIVYVSLGTVFNDQPAIYRTLLAGVHAAGARAIVAAGVSLSAMQEAARPDDVVVAFAPQIEILARVQAAIIHGGNNSTNETLRAGKPLLMVPFGGEQVANARRGVALGVARALDPSTLATGDVAEALTSLLTPEAASRSQALAQGVPPEDGAERVVAALESLQAS